MSKRALTLDSTYCDEFVDNLQREYNHCVQFT